ncbi:MAG: ribonuclease P protein component [Planctomycetaceae bacterium]|jgi:ribonuclease P protein component|nr:ribonuclease P protein component [Planctomycetaceae bacterium]
MESFPKKMRLCKTPEFKKVFDARRSAADGTFIVFVILNGLGHCRLGLSVSKKVGNAVVRNRWKRVIRTAFRKNQAAFSDHFDIVVVPQKGATLPAEHDAEKSLSALVAKI